MLYKQHTGALAAIGFTLVAFVAIGLAGQAPAGPARSISYVASVRSNNSPDARTFSEYSPGGRLTATAVTVMFLLRNAYRVQPYQLAGAPAWISRKRYDIAAKVDDSPAPSQQAFLQALLKDRFALAVHQETREQHEGEPGRGDSEHVPPSLADAAAPRGQAGELRRSLARA